MTLLQIPEGWERVEDRDAISREYRFKNFDEAFAFMTRCALEAEKMDHHPEWFNVYNRIDVVLTTHDTGGVSKKDVIFAQIMNRFFES